ncbi:MAG TPA: AMIN domain-containing protein [Gemmatimonadaceae bacterium]|nr:AMIN domain-containing protein [Gemmatimonadaceae bacterium]
MKRGMTLVTAAVVTLASSAATARPASATPDGAAFGAGTLTAGGDAHTRRIVAAPLEGTVISLSVVPNPGRAEVIIGIDGPVHVKDFTLRDPDKIVVDITGATLGLPAGESYDQVARGGITNVRYSQFRRNVVRVVLTLDTARTYTVVRGEHELRIAVESDGASFASWNIGDGPRPAQRRYASTALTQAPAPASSTRPVPARTASHELAQQSTEASLIAARPMVQRAQQPRITIAWENADIHDVLAAFAAFSGRTIIPAKDVTGKVTAEIVNQPWDVAMRAILNANGFDAIEDLNGIIIVDTFEHIESRQAAQPLATRTIRLNYTRSTSVAQMVADRLSRDCGRMQSGAAAAGPGAGAAGQSASAPMIVLNPSCPARGAVTADSLTNSISITDVPSNLESLEAYAKSLDLRQPQVNIKAKIILVDRTTIEGLGLRYDIGTQNQFFNDVVPRLDSTGSPLKNAGQVALGGNTIAAIANAKERIPSAALQLVYSTAIGAFDLTTFLEALQQNSLLDVQAEPSASVLNNRTANLTAGTQVPIRVIDASSGANNTGAFPKATVRMQETGIILNVTPMVTANHQVQMRVHVENSDVQDQGGDVGAVFPKQSVDNEVLVADGETAVMGGLTQTTVRLTKSGIPLLVDLPLIGRLFGVTQRQEQKRDLLILITPHIIDDGQQPSDQSR